MKELFKTSKGRYVAPAPIENLLNANSNIEQSCVMGLGQPQPCAVVLLSEQLRKKGKSGEVSAMLEELLGEVNGQLPDHEKLTFLAVASEPWVIANGLLTPSMKIKRAALEERYGPKLDAWYESKERVLWEAN